MKIVYAYVCGDIIHKGHLVHLQNAKALGDILIVGVLTREAIEEKNSMELLSLDERCDIIRSLEVVDIVVPQKRYSPVENILMIKPDIVMESESHSEKVLQETITAAETVGARVIILPYWPLISSTKIKEKIGKSS